MAMAKCWKTLVSKYARMVKRPQARSRTAYLAARELSMAAEEIDGDLLPCVSRGLQPSGKSRCSSHPQAGAQRLLVDINCTADGSVGCSRWLPRLMCEGYDDYRQYSAFTGRRSAGLGCKMRRSWRRLHHIWMGKKWGRHHGSDPVATEASGQRPGFSRVLLNKGGPFWLLRTRKGLKSHPGVPAGIEESHDFPDPLGAHQHNESTSGLWGKPVLLVRGHLPVIHESAEEEQGDDTLSEIQAQVAVEPSSVWAAWKARLEYVLSAAMSSELREWDTDIAEAQGEDHMTRCRPAARHWLPGLSSCLAPLST